MGGLGRRIPETVPDFYITPVSLNMMPADLLIALNHSRRLIANPTSAKLAPRPLKLKGQAPATLNTRDLGAVRAQLRSRPKPENLPRAMGADAVLLT